MWHRRDPRETLSCLDRPQIVVLTPEFPRGDSTGRGILYDHNGPVLFLMFGDYPRTLEFEEPWPAGWLWAHAPNRENTEPAEGEEQAPGASDPAEISRLMAEHNALNERNSQGPDGKPLPQKL